MEGSSLSKCEKVYKSLSSVCDVCELKKGKIASFWCLWKSRNRKERLPEVWKTIFFLLSKILAHAKWKGALADVRNSTFSVCSKRCGTMPLKKKFVPPVRRFYFLVRAHTEDCVGCRLSMSVKSSLRPGRGFV